MLTPLQSLAACGTKLWLDSVDPVEIATNRANGATGATSNPIIISGLINTGRFDGDLKGFLAQGLDDHAIAWAMTDKLVKDAQAVFEPVWKETQGDDGWVSFELDPLIEDTANPDPTDARSAQYIALGKKWAAGHKNRMIKVPATPGGLGALEELVAAGVCVNVTLIFSPRQYIAARDATWRGMQRLADQSKVKTVYSIFVSRVDVYTEKSVPTLSPAAQGLVGIVNAKQIWKMNHDFWATKGLKLNQEMIFASTGTKKPEDPVDKYVGSLAGSDIETNPPSTNDKVQALGKSYTRQVDVFPSDAILTEIDREVDVKKMENFLMEEGLAKFADPQKALLKLISQKREALKVH